MRFDPHQPTRLASAVLWFGVLGAPAAWVVQFLVTLAFSEAVCNGARAGYRASIDVATTAGTVAAGVVAAAAGACALMAFRATREARGEGGSDEAPPLGRMHFLATVGIAITPLFLMIILMGGLGTLSLPDCRQG